MIHFDVDREEALKAMTVEQKDALIGVASRWRKVEVIGYPGGVLYPYVSLQVYGEGDAKMFLGIEKDGYCHS